MERSHLLIREPFWLGVMLILIFLVIFTIAYFLRKKYGISVGWLWKKFGPKSQVNPIDKKTEGQGMFQGRPEPDPTVARRRSSLQAFTNLGFRMKLDSQSSQDSIATRDSIKNAHNPAAAARFFASLNEVQQSSFASTATNDSDDQGSMGHFGQILAPGEPSEGRRSPFLITPELFLHPDDALRRQKSDRQSVSQRWRRSMETIQKSRSFDDSMSREDSFMDAVIQTRCVSDDDISHRIQQQSQPVQIYIESPSKTDPENWEKSLVRSSSWRRKKFATSPQVTVRLSDSDSDDCFVTSAGPSLLLPPPVRHYDVRSSSPSDVTTDDGSSDVRQNSATSTPKSKPVKKVICSPKNRLKKSNSKHTKSSTNKKRKPRKPKSKDSKDNDSVNLNLPPTPQSSNLNLSFSVVAEIHSSPSIEHRSDDSRATSSSGAETNLDTNPVMSRQITLDDDTEPPARQPRRSRPSRRSKNPFKDSAYQTKDNSISKPTSTPLSPTLSCGGGVVELKLIDMEPETILQRSDPSYITGQLEEAARRLERLQNDLTWRRKFELQTINETADYPGYTCPYSTRAATQDSKQNSVSLHDVTQPDVTSSHAPHHVTNTAPRHVLSLMDGEFEGYQV